MPAERRKRVTEGDKVAGNKAGPLMDQLIERMLPVRPRFTPIDRASIGGYLLPSSVTCFPLLSIVNCWR